MQSLQIHRLLQHVLHHLAHQRMIGNLDVALDVFEARRRLRKHARQQIVRARALDLRSDALALWKTAAVAGCVRPPTSSAS